MATWSADPLGPVPFGGTEEELRAFQAACGRMGQRPPSEGEVTPVLPPAAQRQGTRDAAMGQHWSQVLPPAPQDAVRIDDGVQYDPAPPPVRGQVDRSQPGWDWRGRAKGIADL